jgi:Flp pilus assembly protein TadB
MGLLRLLAVSCAGAACLLWALPAGRTVRIELSARAAGRALPAVLAGLGGGALAAGMSGDAAIGAALGVFAAMIPPGVASARRRRDAAAAAAAWPDFIAVLRGRISAGDSVADATRLAAIRHGGPLQPLATLLERNRARPFRETLSAARDAFADPIADRVLSTLGTASEVGGGRVDAVLAVLSRSVADETRLRSAHAAALTQQRLTAAVALVAPWALLLLTITTNPQAAAAFRTSSGRVVILVGFAGTLAGRILSARAARLAAPPRVLA